MRTVNFRDGVLHAVAYKLGLDPEQSNFLTNAAIPIGTYIDEWVRRVYDSRDWPEWTLTYQFTPSSHIVSYDYVAGNVVTKLGRILKVYLVNPETTDAPVDTPFTLLDNGVHVGHEHGTSVWIRYLAPPPRFTAVKWRPDVSYKIGDLVYSYTTGECYSSRVNNNLNHDPAGVSIHGLGAEITQELIPANPGIIQRNKILVVSFLTAAPSPAPPDPVLNGSSIYVDVWDGPDVGTANLLGDANIDVSPDTPLADIVTNVVSQLQAEPLLSAFTITGDTGAFTVTIEAPSDFYVNHSSYLEPPPNDTVTHVLKVGQLQAYVPALSPVDGVPQITQITITPATTLPGATYTLVVTDSMGAQHSVDYTSLGTDTGAQILQGLLFAVEASSDPYFSTVTMSFDPSAVTLSVSIKDQASVDVTPDRPAPPQGGAYWTLVLFPKAIADQVIRGAYADLLKEWGQASKADSEEQAVPAELESATGKFQTTPNPQLTGQQSPLSRYKS